jgi:hypothetical protein
MNILFISDEHLSGDDGNDDENYYTNNRKGLSLENFLTEESALQLSHEQIQELERRYNIYLDRKHNREDYSKEDAQFIQETLIRSGRFLHERIFE